MADNRGGPRSASPGRVYPNRSDLTASTGQTVAPPDTPSPTEHGQVGRRDAARRALPLPERTNRLAAPSARPDEPVQAGLPVGPGPGQSPTGANLSTLDHLRSIYGRYPNDDLARMIEFLSQR
ncbi:MAG: hypothetical protein GY773_00885 [Actinomycetia bacterium]|nr:hypothetical protein [Actinomycetes bacterium]